MSGSHPSSPLKDDFPLSEPLSEPWSNVSMSQQSDDHENSELTEMLSFVDNSSKDQNIVFLKSFIQSNNISSSIKRSILGIGSVLFQGESSEKSDGSDASDASDNEERTPDDVLELIHDITILNNNLDNISTEELTSEDLTTKLTTLTSRLNSILGNDEITSTSLNGVLEPEKVNNPDDEITVISALSKSTTMIMQNETLSKIRSNLSSENTYQSVDRNTNVKNIIKSMLQNDMRRQIHMKDGKDDTLRDQGERFLDTDKQFINVWSGTQQLGTILQRTNFAKTNCCYLCGGNLVTNKITSPEMEHKLPSIEFYTKVHNINEKYPELLGLWKKYIDSDEAKNINELYKYINCDPKTWIKAPMDSDEPIDRVKTKVNVTMSVFKDFIVQQGASQDNFEEFIALLKVHLMEFAYSHHTCNQLKENDNLNTSKLRQNYINSIAIAKEEGSYSSKPLLKESKLHEERKSNIPDRSELLKRNLIIGGHMNLINQYIEEYALLLLTENEKRQYNRSDKLRKEYALKKLMVQSIKNTIDYIIKTKNIEKQKKMEQIRDEHIFNATAGYRQILDVLKYLQINTNTFLKLTGRGRTNYFKSEPYGILITSIRANENIEKAVSPDPGNLMEMEPETMYNNLVNSSLGNELVEIYTNNKYPFLNDDIALYFSDRLNDNNTAGDSNEEEAKVEEEVEAEAKVEDPNSSFESAKESGNETDDTITMDQATSSDGESVKSVKSRNSSDMAVSSDELGDREKSDARSEESSDEEEMSSIFTRAAIDEKEDSRKIRPIVTADGPENTRGRSNSSRSSRSSSKTPVKSNTPRPGLRSQSTSNIPQPLRRSPRNISPRNDGRPQSTTNLPKFKFGGKRKTNKMRRKQTPKRSMRRKTKNTRSSRKRTHRKTNTNKHTHTRRRR
jgi:hypothetical protein